jgi:hypothetical protein
LKIPDQVRKCVVFVTYVDHDGVERLGGTAFLAGERLPETFAIVQWIVTAAHVVHFVKAKSVDGMVRLRANLRAGGTKTISIHADKWAFHDTHDVAAFPLALPQTAEGFDTALWPLEDENLATDARIVDEAIGIGDEVYFPGLFKYHPGKERNIPIVRAGNIAAMPGEPLRLSYWGNMSAYLIETRSIGGLSGSPVFVQLGNFFLNDKGDVDIALSRTGRYLLLGVMSGHYRERQEAGDPLVDTAEPETDSAEDKLVNMGIGIVVAVQRMMELINMPQLDAAKATSAKKWKEQMDKLTVPDAETVPDVTHPEPDEARPAIESREDFENALRKVSRRKLARPDEGTSGTSG